MVNEQVGVMEAASMKKSVVKINNVWYRFDDTLKQAVSGINFNDTVLFTAQGQKLLSIMKQNNTASIHAREKDSKENSTDSDMLRMSALKSAVALAQAYEFSDTAQLLHVADAFLVWLRDGTVQGIALQQKKKRGRKKKEELAAETEKKEAAGQPAVSTSEAKKEDVMAYVL